MSDEIKSVGGPMAKSKVDLYWHGLRCLTCNTSIYSYSTHDFKYCKCGYESEFSISVDGGESYFHYSWGKAAKYKRVKRKKTAKELTRKPYVPRFPY